VRAFPSPIDISLESHIYTPRNLFRKLEDRRFVRVAWVESICNGIVLKLNYVDPFPSSSMNLPRFYCTPLAMPQYNNKKEHQVTEKIQ
jgi:hypothetical protein